MRFLGAVFAVLAVVGLASSALAWVPPSFYVIRGLAQRHSGLERGRFVHRISIYKKGGELDKTLSESLTLLDADRVAVKIFDDSGAEIANQTRKISGNKGDEIQRPVLYDLVFARNAASIFDHFRALGLPLKTESDLYAEKEGNLPFKPEASMKYDKLDGKVVVLVGTDSSTKLWVEKESFLAVKAIFPTSPEVGHVSDILETRLNYSTRQRAFQYPNTVQIFRNGALWVRLETLEAQPDSTVAEIAHAKSEPSGDLKDFLEMYFKWVR